MATSKQITYFEGIGRRKTSSARVRITPSTKKTHSIVVNDLAIDKYFDLEDKITSVRKPLSVLATEIFEISVHVDGGGITGQAEAIQLGLSRALVKYDETLKKQLKDNGYLTRNPRAKERKKPGLKKARKAGQWSKR